MVYITVSVSISVYNIYIKIITAVLNNYKDGHNAIIQYSSIVLEFLYAFIHATHLHQLPQYGFYCYDFNDTQYRYA